MRLPARALLVAGLVLFVATASSRAQTGGNAPVAGKTSQDGFTVIDLMNPISGVQAGRSKIRAFQVYSTTGCRIMLKIFRPLLLSYEFVGASNLVYASPQQVSTLRCDIPVQDGDLVGFTTYDVGAGAVDYTDDNPNLQASVAYIGDVGTVLKANGTVLHYVRSIRVIGVPSDDLPEDFKTGNTYVPVVTRAGGANGTLFRTEGTLFNSATEATAEVTLAYVPTETAGLDTAVSKTVNIKPLETVSIHDLLKDTFGLDAGLGMLRIGTIYNIHTRWRIVNDTDHGSFGQDLPAVPLVEALPYDNQCPNPRGDQFFLVGAEESDAFRTNFGAVNLDGTSELEFNLQPFDNAGAPLAEMKTYKLKPFSHQQWNRVLETEFGIPHGNGKVNLVAAPNDKSLTARLFVYLSIIDNVSEDPVFVRGARMSSF